MTIMRALNQLSPHYKVVINAVRISKANTLSHELKKFHTAWNLINEGHDVVTEAIFKNGKRCDVLDLTDGTIYEILKSETIEKAKKKVKDYPEYFEVRFIKTKGEDIPLPP